MGQFYLNKFLPKIIRLATFLVVVWILVLLGKSVWQNWHLRQSIWKLNEQIASLEKQKKDLENLNLYYSSDSFKELEARKRLGLKKPGEKMVILPSQNQANGSFPTASPGTFPEELEKEKETVAGAVVPSKIPNWLLWWQYFTK